jgi:hypothetical protein
MGGPESWIEHEVLSKRNREVSFADTEPNAGSKLWTSLFLGSVATAGTGIRVALSNPVIKSLQTWATAHPDGEFRQVSTLASAILLSLGFPSGLDCRTRWS